MSEQCKDFVKSLCGSWGAARSEGRRVYARAKSWQKFGAETWTFVKKAAPYPWAKGPGKIHTNPAKQGQVLGLAVAGHNNREIAKALGLNRETVARILSKEEHSQLLQTYRGYVMSNAVPLALKGLMFHLKKKDRETIIQTLLGSKTFLRHHEIDVSSGTPTERDYSDAMVRFYYEYGHWPTKQEAIEFDKTILVEPLVKKVH